MVEQFFYCPFSWFESNQSGIETSTMSSWEGAIESLNRTRVELKHVLRNENLPVLDGLNRTRVELKRFRGRVVANWSRPFESNQSGIETTFRAGNSSRSHSGLNRTRVELKRKQLTPQGEHSMSLNRTRVELKHDRLPITLAHTASVWIEPEWNWNRRFQLKWTNLRLVWIEPEWNWNVNPALAGTPDKPSLNRTRVELKQTSVLPYGDPSNLVWIEPEWNWNIHAIVFSRQHSQVWIEPEWNWNIWNKQAIQRVFESLNRTRVELKHLLKGLYRALPRRFESNQSGIET